MKRKLRSSMLCSIAGVIWMVAGLFAALAHKPIAVEITCGALFLLLAAMLRKRERAAVKVAAKRNPSDGTSGDPS